jgi:hypothetical protein
MVVLLDAFKIVYKMRLVAAGSELEFTVQIRLVGPSLVEETRMRREAHHPSCFVCRVVTR